MIERDGDYAYDLTLHGGEGRTTIKHYFVKESSMPVSVQMWTLEPGASEGMHTHHDPPLEELYLVVSGTATLTLDGEVRELGPGDAMLSKEGTDHDLVNTGSEPLRLVMVWGPPSDADLTGFSTVQHALKTLASQT